jgi:signal transduction histidine kinase
MSRLARLWPRRMAGRMILLTLAGFIIAQVIVLAVLTWDRRETFREYESYRLLERIAVTLRIVEASPPEMGRAIADNASSPFMDFWISPGPVLPTGIETGDFWHRDRHERIAGLRQRVGTDRDIRFNRGEAFLPGATLPERLRRVRDPEHGGDASFKSYRPNFALSIGLVDGRWLNVGFNVRRRGPDIGFPVLLSFLVTGTILALVIILSVRRVSRPLERLASAADRMGRGEAVAPIPEEGPDDLKETIRAFNLMQERLRRFVEDRTKMLAALGHDLRTPITSLKLQAEFVEDEELRERMQRQLDDMQQMAESALAFARDAADGEETSRTDIGALAESLADDLASLGLEVTCTAPDRSIVHACRPVALKRALTNLVRNAVAYGGSAEVSVRKSGGEILIEVADNGPGIPEADMDRAFTPFERLDPARSAETGGAGLGLTIARSIARAHGGDVRLANRSEGGLVATIALPVA